MRNASNSLFTTQTSAHLPLLADDGNGVLQLHVMKQTLQEDVCHANEVVILLRFIERIANFTVQPVHLEETGNYYQC